MEPKNSKPLDFLIPLYLYLYSQLSSAASWSSVLYTFEMSSCGPGAREDLDKNLKEFVLVFVEVEQKYEFLHIQRSSRIYNLVQSKGVVRAAKM